MRISFDSQAWQTQLYIFSWNIFLDVTMMILKIFWYCRDIPDSILTWAPNLTVRIIARFIDFLVIPILRNRQLNCRDLNLTHFQLISTVFAHYLWFEIAWNWDYSKLARLLDIELIISCFVPRGVIEKTKRL